jgi:hypothetical protein
MVRSDARVAQPASMADASVGRTLSNYVTQTLAVAAAEVEKLRHDPLEFITRAVQPAVWLLLFGGVMAQVRGILPAASRTSTTSPLASSRKAFCSSRSFTVFLPFGREISA